MAINNYKHQNISELAGPAHMLADAYGFY